MPGFLHTARTKTVNNPLFVAYLALFLALTGGTAAYAAATIGSADIIDSSILSQDIKNGAVKGADVGKDTLTGADIDEATLAGRAQSFAMDVPWGTTSEPFIPLITLGDLTLAAQCQSPGVGAQIARLQVTSTVDAAVSVSGTSGQVGQTPEVAQDHRDLTGGAPWAWTYTVVSDANAYQVERQLIYQNDHEVIVVALHHLNSGSSQRCQFSGVATPAQL